MPIKSTIIDGIIYTEIFGELNYDSVLRQIDFIVSLKDKMVNRYELNDHTHTKGINLSGDDIRRIATYSVRTRDIFQHSIVSVYTPNDFTFGIARMFETFYELEEHPVQSKIFRNRDDAIQFLKDEKKKYG